MQILWSTKQEKNCDFKTKYLVITHPITMNYKDIVLTNLGSLNKKYMVVFKAMVDVTP